jgi:prevent-host-death family protein
MLVSTTDAKNRLSKLLGEVARGGQVTITKRGIPIAKLVAAIPTFDREKARLAADGLRALSRGRTLNGIKIKNLLDEGRS